MGDGSSSGAATAGGTGTVIASGTGEAGGSSGDDGSHTGTGASIGNAVAAGVGQAVTEGGGPGPGPGPGGGPVGPAWGGRIAVFANKTAATAKLLARVKVERYQIGDFVRFEGTFSTGTRMFEPSTPRAEITTPRGTKTVTPTRFGQGLYFTDVTMDVVGEITVRFTGYLPGDLERQTFSEQTFEVVKAIPSKNPTIAEAAAMPVPGAPTAASRARTMMLEDLAKNGLHLTDQHSDAVVAGAHAQMLKSRAEARARGPRPMAPLAPLRAARR